MYFFISTLFQALYCCFDSLLPLGSLSSAIKKTHMIFILLILMWCWVNFCLFVLSSTHLCAVSLHCQLAELLTTCWLGVSVRALFREELPKERRPCLWAGVQNWMKRRKEKCPEHQHSLFLWPHWMFPTSSRSYCSYLPLCNDEMNLLKLWTWIKAFLKLLFWCIFYS